MNRRAHAPVAPGSALLTSPLPTLRSLPRLPSPASASVSLHAQSANSLYKNGQSAEARQDYDAAFDFYQKANAKNPKDLSYRAALYRVRQTASSMHLTNGRKLQQSGDEQGALVRVPARRCNRSRQRSRAAGNHRTCARKTDRPATSPKPPFPEPAGEQQDINSISAPV